MRILLTSALAVSLCMGAFAEEKTLTKEEASLCLHRAVAFFRQEVSGHGGYLWQYAADLSLREGEGKAGPDQAWVQPPGTPNVGLAYLEAYLVCGDPLLLEAAVETGHALVKGQLRSGGWDYRIEFSEERRRKCAYRVAPAGEDGFNTTTLDDNNTQHALRFLMRLDRTLEFKNDAIHGAVLYALDALIAAQYPNGAWPQRFAGPPDASAYPVKQAAYPETWPREHPAKDYKDYYTFNDNTMGDMITTMLEAGEVYGNDACRRAALRAGDFILLAQMPAPQPGWAQQYDADMHPAWARKFEPPAVTGGESQGIMRTLIHLYRATGEKRFVECLPRAIEYFRTSTLPDGQLARFYELETNKPLYFTKDYQLTFSDEDMPTHYSFKSPSSLDDIEKEMNRALEEGPWARYPAWEPKKPVMTPELARKAAAIVAAMDERGAWVELGTLRYQDKGDTTSQILRSITFAENMVTLARFVGASN